MVKIRLQRFGAHKAPKYRIVAADSRSPRDGKFLEIVGTYNPLTDPATVTLDAEKVNKWLANGAQPTETAKSILQTAGALEVKGNSPTKTNNKKKKA